MINSELLNHDHWARFMHFIRLEKGIRDMVPNDQFIRLSKLEKQDNQFELLWEFFDESVEELTACIEKYLLWHIKDHPGHCLVCCKLILQKKEHDCCLCCSVYDNLISSLNGNDFKKWITIQHKNSREYLTSRSKQFALEQKWKTLDKESRQYSKSNENFNEFMKGTLKEVDEQKTKIEYAQNLENTLLRQQKQLLAEIESLKLITKHNISLYKAYKPDVTHQRIELESSGAVIRAKKDLGGTKFPVDLVVAFLKQTSEESLKNATCFIMLPKESWNPIDNNMWEADIAAEVFGKIAGRFFLNFSSLVHSDNYIRIEYKSKAISFI